MSEPTESKEASAQSSSWSLWSGATTQKAWSYFETAQKQAQEAWNNYDGEKLKQRLNELGKTATEYIDEADRRIETMENGAMSYLQQRGQEIVSKVKEATEEGTKAPAGDSEVLYTGPDRKPLSRLDSEIMTLNSSPLVILKKTEESKEPVIDASEQKKLLEESGDLQETFKSLVPSKLTENEFWSRYSALLADLKQQDAKRKAMIGQPGQEEDLDGWGSSDDE